MPFDGKYMTSYLMPTVRVHTILDSFEISWIFFSYWKVLE